MRCDEVRTYLAAYLDGEVTSSERALIQAHLSTCETCQREIASLDVTQHLLRHTLHRAADSAAPSPQAWARLQERLDTSHPTNGFMHRIRMLSGGFTMHKSYSLGTLILVVLVGIVFSYFSRGNPSSVSAQEVLDRAYAAQRAAIDEQGIEHIRTEVYYNLSLYNKGGDPTGPETTRVIENYRDLQTGWYRSVTTDTATNAIVDVSAYDGTYIYATVPNEGDQSGFTIYRVPEPIEVMQQWGVAPGRNNTDLERDFEAMRNNPDTELVGQEDWLDGRTAYVLRSNLDVDALAGRGMDVSGAFTTMYFDVDTYELLESRLTIIKDGEEQIANYTRQLANEILPADTAIVWDLSDLSGITIVDDPNGEIVGLLPIPLTLDELLDRADSVYVLQTLPEGFVMEISAPPSANDGDFYIITYHDDAGNYLALQAPGGGESLVEQSTETYETPNGLTLHIFSERGVYTTAVVETPDGASFMLTSNLPREQVEALADDLVPATK